MRVLQEFTVFLKSNSIGSSSRKVDKSSTHKIQKNVCFCEENKGDGDP